MNGRRGDVAIVDEDGGLGVGGEKREVAAYYDRRERVWRRVAQANS